MEILFVFRHGFKEFYDHRKCDRSGYDIRDGLGYLNSGESKDSVHDTEIRDRGAVAFTGTLYGRRAVIYALLSL